MTSTVSNDINHDQRQDPVAKSSISSRIHGSFSSSSNTKTSGETETLKSLDAKQSFPENRPEDIASCDRIEALELRIQGLELHFRLSRLQCWGNTREMNRDKHLNPMPNNRSAAAIVAMRSRSQIKIEAPKHDSKQELELSRFDEYVIGVEVLAFVVLLASVLNIYHTIFP